MGEPNEDGSLNVPDEVQAAFHRALEAHIGDEEYPVLNFSLEYALRTYPERSNTNVGHNVMRAAQSSMRREQRRYQSLSRLAQHYPHGMDDPERWEYFF